MIDTHVHSAFSADSEMEIETACQEAINAGLKGITFTDHLDIDFPEFDDEFSIDFIEYNAAVDRAKYKYKGYLKVFKGIEAGIQPHVLKETEELVKTFNFDYVLGSTHIINGMDPYKLKYYEGKGLQEAYDGYLEKVLFTVCNFKDFDAAGHLDYIIRSAPYEDRSLRYFNHSDLLDEIFKCLASSNRGMEINTSSYREASERNTPEYDINLLKRYRELGGEIVTLGSDSHTPQFLGYKFNFFKCMLKEAGFKYAAHFENRKPVFELI